MTQMKMRVSKGGHSFLLALVEPKIEYVYALKWGWNCAVGYKESRSPREGKYV
jgi:hypothetical protein